MGSTVGKISEETPQYSVVSRGEGYEIREYASNIVAEVTYDGSTDRTAGFMVLANYIGALGKANNVKPGSTLEEKIAMTAPVLTKQEAGAGVGEPEKIAMTAPVLMTDGGRGSGEGTKMTTMQFVLPSKYKSLEEVPRPTDPRVSIRDVGAKKYGVVTFSGIANEKLEQAKLGFLREALEKGGFQISGPHILAQYNPPWTIPSLRTNEIWIPLS